MVSCSGVGTVSKDTLPLSLIDSPCITMWKYEARGHITRRMCPMSSMPEESEAKGRARSQPTMGHGSKSQTRNMEHKGVGPYQTDLSILLIDLGKHGVCVQVPLMLRCWFPSCCLLSEMSSFEKSDVLDKKVCSYTGRWRTSSGKTFLTTDPWYTIAPW